LAKIVAKRGRRFLIIWKRSRKNKSCGPFFRYVTAKPVERAWSDGAVIGGVVDLGWTQEGKHQQRVIRIAHVWVKRHGDWKMTYTQVTRVPK
jgi:hypothetical protein